MEQPGTDIELFAKTTGEVVKALPEQSGSLEPVRAFAEYLASSVHYRFYPRVAERAMRAAEKIRASGLPRRAFDEVPDPLLRAILMPGAEKDEPTMRERWENLLANALTIDSAEIKKALVTVLDDLEPAEAAQLDKYAGETTPEELRVTRFPIQYGQSDIAGLDNLVRLGLLD